MAEFGQFLINNMKSSLEPEDLRILNRNNCVYRVSVKSESYFTPIKEEENSSNNESEEAKTAADVQQTGQNCDKPANVVPHSEHDAYDKEISKLEGDEINVEDQAQPPQQQDAEKSQEYLDTGLYMTKLKPKLFMRRLNARVFNENGVLNGYWLNNINTTETTKKHYKHIGRLGHHHHHYHYRNAKNGEFILKPADINNDSSGKKSNVNYPSVRNIKWGSYMDSWKSLADKYHAQQSTGADRVDSKKVNLKTSVYKGKKKKAPLDNHSASSFYHRSIKVKSDLNESLFSAKSCSSQSQKVTNNPIYISDSKIKSVTGGGGCNNNSTKNEQDKNNNNETTANINSNNKSLKPTVKFEINQLINENARHLLITSESNSRKTTTTTKYFKPNIKTTNNYEKPDKDYERTNRRRENTNNNPVTTNNEKKLLRAIKVFKTVFETNENNNNNNNNEQTSKKSSESTCSTSSGNLTNNKNYTNNFNERIRDRNRKVTIRHVISDKKNFNEPTSKKLSPPSSASFKKAKHTTHKQATTTTTTKFSSTKSLNSNYNCSNSKKKKNNNNNNNNKKKRPNVYVDSRSIYATRETNQQPCLTKRKLNKYRIKTRVRMNKANLMNTSSLYNRDNDEYIYHDNENDDGDEDQDDELKQKKAVPVSAKLTKAGGGSIYSYKSKLIPSGKINYSPCDPMQATSSSSSNLKKSSSSNMGQHSSSSAVSNALLVDKCKIKNKEKILSSWDKIMKKAAKDPEGLRQMLKLNQEKLYDEYEKLRGGGAADTQLNTSDNNNNNKDGGNAIKSNGAKNNVSRFFKLNKKINTNNNVQVAVKKCEQKKSKKGKRERNESGADLLDKIFAQPTGATGKQEELLRNLFSYLNNYSDDGSTIKNLNQPNEHNKQLHFCKQLVNRRSFLTLFSNNNNNNGCGENFFKSQSEHKLIESSLTFKTISNYKVNSEQTSSSCQEQANPTRSSSTSTVFDQSASYSDHELATRQPTSSVVVKTTGSKQIKSTSNFPYYFRCCMDKNSQSTLGSKHQFEISNRDDGDGDGFDHDEDNEHHAEDESTSTDQKQSNECSSSQIKTNTKTVTSYQLDLDDEELFDLEKLIKSIGDDRKLEQLKNKLSIYIKSKKINNTSNTLADATSTSGIACSDEFIDQQQKHNNNCVPANAKVDEAKTNATLVVKCQPNAKQKERKKSESDTIYDNKHYSSVTAEEKTCSSTNKDSQLKHANSDEVSDNTDNQKLDRRVLKLIELKLKQKQSSSSSSTAVKKTMPSPQNEPNADNNIEMFYFTSESPTRRTLAIDRTTQHILKEILENSIVEQPAVCQDTTDDKLCQSQPVDRIEPATSEEKKPTLPAASRLSIKNTTDGDSNNNNTKTASHQYRHQNIFRTLFKTKTACKKCEHLKVDCKCNLNLKNSGKIRSKDFDDFLSPISVIKIKPTKAPLKNDTTNVAQKNQQKMGKNKSRLEKLINDLYNQSSAVKQPEAGHDHDEDDEDDDDDEDDYQKLDKLIDAKFRIKSKNCISVINLSKKNRASVKSTTSSGLKSSAFKSISNPILDNLNDEDEPDDDVTFDESQIETKLKSSKNRNSLKKAKRVDKIASIPSSSSSMNSLTHTSITNNHTNNNNNNHNNTNNNLPDKAATDSDRSDHSDAYQPMHFVSVINHRSTPRLNDDSTANAQKQPPLTLGQYNLRIKSRGCTEPLKPKIIY